MNAFAYMKTSYWLPYLLGLVLALHLTVRAAAQQSPVTEVPSATHTAEASVDSSAEAQSATPDAPHVSGESVQSIHAGHPDAHRTQPKVPHTLVIASQSNEEAPPTVSIKPGRGITVTSADQRSSMTVRARVQLRNSVSETDGTWRNELGVRTLRFFVQGSVLDPDLKYTVQLAFGAQDFERGNSSPIFDAFVEYTALRDLNIRVGQYFVPFDRARTIREFALQLVDRQQVVRELTLDRDVGVMLSSSDVGGSKILGYHLFLGSGDGRNHVGAESPTALCVGRFVLRPWGIFDDDQEADITREARPRLALGIGAAYNHHTRRKQSTYGDTFTSGHVNYYHAAADLVFKYQGFSLLTETALRKSSDNVLQGVEDGVPKEEWSRSAWGYFVQGGMMVSALTELVARFEQLKTLGNTDPTLKATVRNQGNQVSAGVNVYLNGHLFKLQSDYTFAFGEDISDGRHLARVQLDASF